jgi:hypothetical protein
MRLQHASRAEVEWLRDTLSSVSAAFGSRIDLTADGSLRLRWKNADRRGML